MMQEIVLAGFGGQGILLAGKVLAHIAMIAGKEVTWMPTYGPAMRGGSANCTVKFSDELIDNPGAEETNILIAMNEPSVKKCSPDVVPGGLILVNADSTASCEAIRSDVVYKPVHCVTISDGVGNARGANFVMLGAAIRLGNLFDREIALSGLMDYFEEVHAKPAIAEANAASFKAGYDLFD